MSFIYQSHPNFGSGIFPNIFFFFVYPVHGVVEECDADVGQKDNNENLKHFNDEDVNIFGVQPITWYIHQRTSPNE